MTELEQYARAVLDGEIVACRRIKQVYALLLDKLLHPEKYKPWVFDEQEANRHIEFIETFCKQAQGKMGAPLKLELFQKAKLQAVFGFVHEVERTRQYNEVLDVRGRKNGKTTEMAAVEIDLLVNDMEGAPEIYNIATKREQALKGYTAAVQMKKQSKDLSIIKKRQSDLYFPWNMGTIQPLASNTNSLDGLNAHGVIIDELAAIKNRDIYDLMKQSMSSRRQPLLFCITTNGFIREGVFDAQYEYACKVLDGKIQDEHFLPFIYELDSRDEWTKEECWIKANPGLGTIKKWDYMRQMVSKALDDLAFRPTVLVKDFNLKENAANAWLTWQEVENTATFDMKFKYGIGGFDAADSIDLNSAKALCMRKNDLNIYVRSMYWIPEEVINKQNLAGDRKERDNVPYSAWIDRGLMRTVPGNKVDKRVFLEWFKELREEYGLYILYIGYDPWHIDDTLLREFKAEFGQNSMIPVRQGTFTLSAPMKDMQADLGADRIIYNDNPVDKWCLMNTTVKTDINGNIQPVKCLDSRKRIDGTVSLICGYKVLQDKKDEIIALNKGSGA